MIWSLLSNLSGAYQKTKWLQSCVANLIPDDTYTAYPCDDYATKMEVIFLFSPKAYEFLSFMWKEWRKRISTYLRQTSEKFPWATEKKWKNAGRKTLGSFLILTPSPPSPLPPLSPSASLWAWKHLNTKFSELFWHSSLCVMTSDSSGDKLKSMSVSAWVFTNLLSGNRIPILETLLYASRHEQPHVQDAYPEVLVWNKWRTRLQRKLASYFP